MRNRLFQEPTVVAQTIQPGRKTVRDRHQILNQFLLKTQTLIVKHDHFGARQIGQMCQQIKAESRQTILVSDYKPFDATVNQSVHNGKQLRSLEVQAAAHLLKPLVYGEPTNCTELLKH